MTPNPIPRFLPLTDKSLAESVSTLIICSAASLPVPDPGRDPSIFTSLTPNRPMVGRCICAWACMSPIPHSTYQRRPIVPESHRSQTAIWPPSLPPVSYIRVKSTSAKPAPAPPHTSLPTKPGLHFRPPATSSPVWRPHPHTLTPNFVPYSSPTLLRPSSTLYSAPSQNIVTMRGSAWIKSAPGPIIPPPLARVQTCDCIAGAPASCLPRAEVSGEVRASSRLTKYGKRRPIGGSRYCNHRTHPHTRTA